LKGLSVKWISTRESKPGKGKIAIWFDGDMFPAVCEDGNVVHCSVLELTWNFSEDPEREWFSHWFSVTPPVL